MKQEFGRTLDTWWGFFPDSMCAEVQRKALGSNSLVDVGRRRIMSAGEEEPPEDGTLEDSYHRPVDGPARRVKRPMTHHPLPPGSRVAEHFYPRGGPPTATAAATAAGFVSSSTSPSFPPQPPPILRLLHDLRSAVTVPPELYNEKLVAEIMYHVGNLCAAAWPAGT